MTFDRSTGIWRSGVGHDEDAGAVGEAPLVPTPLFQTNLFTDLIHVKVLLATTDLSPTFWHAPPALVAAFTWITDMERKKESTDKNVIIRFNMDRS